MIYSFDDMVNRLNTDSVKWDKLKELFGSEDVLPMWVADMDFPSPPEVIQALTERAKLGFYGYTLMSDSYYEAIIHWMKRRHHWDINSEWISYCPGIVTALSLLVQILSEPGNQVIIQSPVYTPFFNVIKNNGRIVKEVPLVLADNRYQMDFDGLEAAMENSKLMILCSPHNPVGRVWTYEELHRLEELCLKHQVFLISDEIHADLVYRGVRHTPLGMLSDEMAGRSVTCVAPSKTFNLAGLKTASIIIANPEIRKEFENKVAALALGLESYFGVTAVQAAYNEGEDWLNQLVEYIEGNLQYLSEYLRLELPMIKLIEPEGTYLAWLDFSALGLDSTELRDFLYNKAKVGLSAGITYGQQGAEFMRMNIACPRYILDEGLKRIKNAINHEFSSSKFE